MSKSNILNCMIFIVLLVSFSIHTAYGKSILNGIVVKQEGNAGVKVVRIVQGSNYDKAGLRKGDIIVRLGNLDIKFLDDFAAASRGGLLDTSSLNLDIKRGGKTLTIEVKCKDCPKPKVTDSHITSTVPVPELALESQAEPSIPIRGSLIVSPDSKHKAYVARKGNKQIVVVDGKESEEYDGIVKGSLVFSPDSKRIAFVARRGNKQIVVVDGKESGEYDGVVEGSFVFSQDGKRVAFVARRGSKQIVVIDGKESGEYDGIVEGSFVFSQDGRRVAFVARRGSKQIVIIDGKESGEYDDIVEGSFVFSQDGKRVAFVVRKGNKQFIVVDGKESGEYDGIVEGSLVFSPDSTRVAYVDSRGNKQFVVVDGKELKQLAKTDEQQASNRVTKDTIKRIKQGEHGDMPQLIQRPATGSSEEALTIENATAHRLMIHFSGPVTKTVEISTGKSVSVELITGQYEVAAEVPGTDIMPFYGSHSCEPNMHYQLQFFIKKEEDTTNKPRGGMTGALQDLF
ncbi:MAG: PDZ domain-containing protein [Candidatus Scalindua sp.]|nr:PDZ domain-containing protein [Candidatus Scalindua sp.]